MPPELKRAKRENQSLRRGRVEARLGFPDTQGLVAADGPEGPAQRWAFLSFTVFAWAPRRERRGWGRKRSCGCVAGLLGAGE